MDQQEQESQTNARAGNNNNVLVVGAGDDEYLDSFPPGWRFRPTNYELIKYYLLKKVNDKQLPLNPIYEAQVYDYHPAILTELYRPTEGKVWFFFVSTTRKNGNGKRTKRAAGNYGYWKVTGKPNIIKNSRKVEIGCRRAFVFYKGGHRGGEKTQWMMHEYKVTNSRNNLNPMQLNKWVLCKIYYVEKEENPGAPPVQFPRQLDASLAVINHANQIVPVTNEFLPVVNSTGESSDAWQSREMVSSSDVDDDINLVDDFTCFFDDFDDLFAKDDDMQFVCLEEGEDFVPESQINPVSSDIGDGEQSPPAI